MGLLRFILVGAAVGYGINYITKKNENGTSIAEDIIDKAPGWFDDAKKFAEQTVDQVRQTVQPKA